MRSGDRVFGVQVFGVRVFRERGGAWAQVFSRLLREPVIALVICAVFSFGVQAACRAAIPQRQGNARAGEDNVLTAKEKRAGWILLFDGKSLDGWMTSSHTPSKKPVEDGCINPHGCGGYMMVHKEQWSDFILSLDYKISEKCNSGVFVRTSPLEPYPGKDVGWNGIEVQIMDSPTADYYDTGAFYDLVKPSKQAQKPVGEWNHMEITCKGPLLEVVLNGEKVNRIDLDAFTEPYKRPDGSAHKFDRAMKDQPRKGYLGLQDHGADCWYKNIKLKPLTRKTS